MLGSHLIIQPQGIYRFSPFQVYGHQLLYQSHALCERVYNGYHNHIFGFLNIET